MSYDIGSKAKHVDNHPQITIASKEESSVCVCVCEPGQTRRDYFNKEPMP